MQKPNQFQEVRGAVKATAAHNGGTKGHSKPSAGSTHAGPPPPPQPTKK